MYVITKLKADIESWDLLHNDSGTKMKLTEESFEKHYYFVILFHKSIIG